MTKMKNLISINFWLISLLGLSPALTGQVLNDECFTATVISDPKDYCSGSSEFTNTGATESADARPFCWSDKQNDVWFALSFC